MLLHPGQQIIMWRIARSRARLLSGRLVHDAGVERKWGMCVLIIMQMRINRINGVVRRCKGQMQSKEACACASSPALTGNDDAQEVSSALFRAGGALKTVVNGDAEVTLWNGSDGDGCAF